MEKLWEKGYKLNKEIEAYTTGEDYALDQELVEWDVLGSIAHSAMLLKVGLLKKNEHKEIKSALIDVCNLSKKGRFTIKKENEDVHTAIELYLNKKTRAGRKIHAGRSRNDQVMVDMRLYSKSKLLEIEEEILGLCNVLLKISKKHSKTPMPGYTHMRKAMPSSVALFFSSFLESLLDDLLLIETAYDLNDACPLGSGAGYGTSLPIDREFVSGLLGFKNVQNNVLYVQNSRGKVEGATLFALSQVHAGISKLASSLLLFSTDEFGFFGLPPECCTGSSIMPQKRNPDVLELMRASNWVMRSYLFEVLNITANLPAGYNRDLQLTKGPLIKGMSLLLSSLKVMGLVVGKIKVNKKNCIKACTPDIFAADEANKLVVKGVPFREAYKKIASTMSKLKKADAVKNILSKKHKGAPGNLCLKGLEKRIKKEKKKVTEKKKAFDEKMGLLLSH